MVLKFFTSIAQDVEKVYYLSIQVVVDFGVSSGLSQEHGSRTSKRLNVNSMFWEVANDPGGYSPFSSVVAESGAHVRDDSG